MAKGSEELTAARREEIITACAELYKTMSFKGEAEPSENYVHEPYDMEDNSRMELLTEFKTVYGKALAEVRNFFRYCLGYTRIRW